MNTRIYMQQIKTFTNEQYAFLSNENLTNPQNDKCNLCDQIPPPPSSGV